MNKTAIEWCDYTWNVVTGCYGPGGTKEKPQYCSYCYARKIATRFKGGKAFPNGFEPTFHENRIAEPFKQQKNSRIFVCSMADLFGDWVPREHIERIWQTAWSASWHTFIFLTKNPKRLKEFNPWPKNVWVGASATNAHQLQAANEHMGVVDCSVKFISFEPLLDYIGLVDLDRMLASKVRWVIIGAQTQPVRLPGWEWVGQIEAVVNNAHIPVFEKDSLAPLFPDRPLRREYPAVQEAVK
jgi:protein gp37